MYVGLDELRPGGGMCFVKRGIAARRTDSVRGPLTEKEKETVISVLKGKPSIQRILDCYVYAIIC